MSTADAIVASSSVEERWRGRPKLALALKTLIVALPLAASVVVSLFAAKRLPLPEGILQTALWWLALMVIAAIVLIIGEAIARRFLPLVALLRLSLLFPGPAPSRIGVARASTRSELRRLGEVVQRDGLGTDLATVARTLVILVGALDVHDRSTRGHSERVRVYADMLGERLGLEEGERDRLRWAALLHDLGKLRVPIEVLHKRANLTDEDWALIHRHPEEGEKMLGPLREWLGEWALVVRHHHERWDGAGYPDGLAGEDISLGARVVAVADSYDVMTSIRSYQPRARSSGAAREELVACAGTQFDPALVRRFLGLSTRRLWLILGPIAWLAQLPVVGPVLSQAAVLTTGQAAVALGAASATEGGFREFPRSKLPRDAAEAPTPDDTVDVGTDITVGPDGASGSAPATSPPPPDEASTTIPDEPVPTSVPPTTVVGDTSGTSSSVPAPSSTGGIIPTPSPPSTSVPRTTVATAPRPSTTRPPSPTTTASIVTTTSAATTDATSTTRPDGTPVPARACSDPPPSGGPPQANPDAASVEPGGSVTVPVLANDRDPDGDLDPSTLTLEDRPRKGTVTRVADGFLYTADPDAAGDDRFSYSVLDEAGSCDSARVSVRIG